MADSGSADRMDVLGRASAATAQDPFGPGDPVEVARLVRRALAAARRRAVDVDALVVAADRRADRDGLGRFTRRALGPHGATIPASGLAAAPGDDHETRLRAAAVTVARSVTDRGRVGIAVALGPGAVATAVCVAAGDVTAAGAPPATPAH